MSNQRVAYRYAKALIELAEEQNALDQVKDDMALFRTTCQQNRDFKLMLINPVVTHYKKLTILKALFKKITHKITQSFFEIVTRKNRESILEATASAFLHLYNIKNGIEEAVVTTSFPLDQSLKKEFEEVVKRITGKKVILSEKVNKEILGGYILKIEDRQIDDTVLSKLNELRYRFSQNPYVGNP
ncbi:MAG: ATP synthase F1 subunit delta [Bacteroidetes bacterium]|nr:ATP synthase F1 subunit delta [Bacteroidota bacterium]MDA1118947.1 ATP synthase F1 subunit delta [Bacteroidota bacterium]